MLPDTAIREFQALFERVYGKPINEIEARKRANNLYRLYKAVCANPVNRISD